jgi:hypothetical protein
MARKRREEKEGKGRKAAIKKKAKIQLFKN